MEEKTKSGSEGRNGFDFDKFKPCQVRDSRHRDILDYWNKKYADGSLRRQGPIPKKLASMLEGAKERCRKSGREFGIQKSDWPELCARIQRGRCELTGERMDLGYPTPTKRNFFSVSLDRIDSQKGYTMGNVRFVCWGVNRMLGEDGESELIPIMVRWLEVRGYTVLSPMPTKDYE